MYMYSSAHIIILDLIPFMFKIKLDISQRVNVKSYR